MIKNPEVDLELSILYYSVDLASKLCTTVDLAVFCIQDAYTRVKSVIDFFLKTKDMT